MPPVHKGGLVPAISPSGILFHNRFMPFKALLRRIACHSFDIKPCFYVPFLETSREKDPISLLIGMQILNSEAGTVNANHIN